MTTKRTDKGRKVLAVVVALFEIGPHDQVHAACKDFIHYEHETMNLTGCREVMSMDLARHGLREIRWIEERTLVHRINGKHLQEVYKSLEEIPEGGSGETTIDRRVIRFKEKEEDDDNTIR